VLFLTGKTTFLLLKFSIFLSATDVRIS